MTFFSSESGAVTVDWVVLTAALVGLGLATMTVVSSGVSDTSNAIDTQLRQSGIVKTSFTPEIISIASVGTTSMDFATPSCQVGETQDECYSFYVYNVSFEDADGAEYNWELRENLKTETEYVSSWVDENGQTVDPTNIDFGANDCNDVSGYTNDGYATRNVCVSNNIGSNFNGATQAGGK